MKNAPFFCCVAFLSLLLGSVYADISLPALLSDHAVLQRSDKTRIWGKASPGEKVHALLSGTSGNAAEGGTTTGSDGHWQLNLDLSKTGNGPFTLTVEGNNKVAVADVIVGEVWLSAGQSNMEYCVRGDREVCKTENPKIDGKDVIVSSLNMSDPIAVRYGWADFPICNLYNGTGLPAAPFRTDRFPLVTENAMQW